MVTGLPVFAGNDTGERQKSAWRGSSRNAEALDFPFELDAARLLHPRPNRLAEGLDVGGSRIALVDEEVAQIATANMTLLINDVELSIPQCTPATYLAELIGALS